ncbi:MAG: twin-arginine translocase TatA/TatE family subunit [bacterium]
MLSAIAFIRPSLGELLLIALVVALIFGTKRLPDLGRSLGSAIRNFQRSFRGEEIETKSSNENTEGHSERSACPESKAKEPVD